MANEVRIRAPRLNAAIRAIFTAAGANARECGLVADHLVEANLKGHDSHGVGMLPAYVANARTGELRLNALPEIVIDRGSILVCEAGLGLGQTMAHDSIAMAITRAREAGSCILALRNAHHIGRIGAWAEQCAAAGLVSLHFVNVISAPAVAPFGGRAARIGTNPVAIGFPRGDRDPIIVDFATSKLAVGKVRVAANSGRPVPPGVLLDGHGEPTTDPAALFTDPKGTLLPFGDHKGWGLSLACELLAGALTGGGTQHFPKRREAIVNNMFSVLVDPEALGTAAPFGIEMDAFLDWARTPLPGRDDEVLLAGEPERRMQKARLAQGIPLDPVTWGQVLDAAQSLGLARADIAAMAEVEAAP